MFTLAWRLVPRTFAGRLTLAISLVFLASMGLATVVQTVTANDVAVSAVSAVVSRQGAQGAPADSPAGGTTSGGGTQSGTPPEEAGTCSYATQGTTADGTAQLGSNVPYRIDWDANGATVLRAPDGSIIWQQDSVAASLRLSAVATFMVFGAASILAVWIVTLHMSRQLQSISDQTASLNPSNPAARIDTGDGRPGRRAVEITRLGNAINGMLERIQAASEAERRFVSNASHELRTPIAAVETNLDAPLAQGRFPGDVEPSVRRALTANRRGAALVEALLTLSRIQSGTLGPADAGGAGRAAARGSTDLNACVSEALADVRQAVEERHIRVRLRYRGVPSDGLPCTVPSPRPLLDLAVGNVIRNAVVHNVPDGGELNVTIGRRAGASGGSVTLTVENSTDAILPADLAELLQPFHRGADSRISASPGAGLGLSIAAASCDAMNATLGLSSPERGRFRAEITFGGFASPRAVTHGHDDGHAD